MAEVAANAAATPTLVRARPRWYGTVGCTIVLLFMGVFVLYPLLLIIYGSFLVPQPGGGNAIGINAWISAWQQPGMVEAITNTFRRAIVTEVISLPAAVLIAWLVARTDIPGKRLIDEFFWIAFFLPALPVLMGWLLLFDPDRGIVNQFAMQTFGINVPPFDIYSFSGIVFAHIASRSIAAKYIFLVPAFRNLDSSMEEASHIVGCGTLATVRRIVLPILMPAILIAMTISLIHALESFEIELILGPASDFYVFSTKMYRLVRSDPPDFAGATVLGLAVLLCVLPLILWQQRLVATRSFVTVTSHFQQRLHKLRGWRWPAFTAISLIGIMVTVVPTVCLMIATFMNLFGHFDLKIVWTGDHWNEVLNDTVLIKSLINTLIMAGSAGTIGVVWFALVAYISVRTRYIARGALDFMTWLPATLPGVVLSLGFLWLFLQIPLFRPFYGTILVLIVAVLVNSLTTGVQLIKGNMVQIGYELEEASFIVGASWAHTFRKIVLPLLGPALIAVALLTFSSAARNVANIVMIVSGNNRPIAMLQVDYMIDGQYERASVVGVIIVLLTLSMVWFARFIGRRFGFRTV